MPTAILRFGTVTLPVYQCSVSGSGSVRLSCLLDMHLDLFFICTDPNPDPSINKHKNEEQTSIYTVLWLLYDFLSLKNDVNVLSKRSTHKKLREDPYQNVKDPEHCSIR